MTAASMPSRFIPPELAQLHQWVIWRRETVGGRETKVPYRSRQPTVKASSTDAETWSSLDEAITACSQPGVDGIGFVVSKDCGLTFVDLDHAADESGRAKPWARAILRQLNSYTELSPSGSGFHVLVKGSIPGPRCRTAHEDGVVELYDNARYFTFVGKPYAGYETIEERQDELDELYNQLFKPEPEPQFEHVAPVLPLPVNLDDRELLERAMNASNGHRFRALWEGDVSAYASHNEADLALCGMLAFWAGGDAGRVDSLFRQSGLMRAKWDENRGQRTYAQMTIDKALEGKTEFYDPTSRAGGEIRHGQPAEVIRTEKKDRWPAPPTDEAFYGLPSSFVWTVDPYTEADPVAVLGQFLALFGVAAGTRPYLEVGAIRHTPRIFVGIVGRSAKARKGDSWAPVERLVGDADEGLKARILGGFGSGEAMVHAVRDERYGEKDGRQVLLDAGEKDKRLMVLETELARLLVAVGREGSTVSQTVRDAWDGRPLRNLVKSSPASSTLHHIGIVGHSTSEELRGRLNEDQVRNGFANRFIWLAVQRSKLLAIPPPFTGEHLDALAETIRGRLRDARMVTRMRWSAESEEVWKEWYPTLSRDRTGRLGVLLERAEAQVLRLSMLYALTDASDVIELDHLRAARALWEYSERSVAYLWGGTTGDAVADKIVEDLEFGPLTTTELMVDTFHKHLSARDLQEVLARLENQGKVRRERVKTSGRPADRWSLAK